MELGEKLIKLRKEKGLSQEEVAELLDVTRQTVSKWETGASTPDFDKVIPICKLYNISTEELFNEKSEKKEIINDDNKNKKALGITISVFLYFLSLIWIILAEETLSINEGVMVSIFFLILALATCIIIYTCTIYKTEKKEKTPTSKLFNSIKIITLLITLIIYLVVSFLTSSWHITWIIWIISLLVIQIIKLILYLRGDLDEK